MFLRAVNNDLSIKSIYYWAYISSVIIKSKHTKSTDCERSLSSVRSVGDWFAPIIVWLSSTLEWLPNAKIS